MSDSKPWEIEGISEAEYWRGLVERLVAKPSNVVDSIYYEEGGFSQSCYFCEEWARDPDNPGHKIACPYYEARTALKEADLDESIAVG